ncbi:MAG: hypothetical protein QMD25_06730 [Caldisericia bacterium]|jgi:hypothetical protein|nr:hypothetical protein [Caldisericia bacterium]
MNSNILKKLIRKFNSLRYPECKAKTIKNCEDELIVEFSGSVASYSCCFDEHFNDLSFLFEDNNIKLNIEEIKRKKDDKFIVKYKIKK